MWSSGSAWAVEQFLAKLTTQQDPALITKQKKEAVGEGFFRCLFHFSFLGLVKFPGRRSSPGLGISVKIERDERWPVSSVVFICPDPLIDGDLHLQYLDRPLQ